MEGDGSNSNSEVDTTGEEIVTDSLADILSSSSESSCSSLTSLTSDNLLQQMTTEDETLKLNEKSEIGTDSEVSSQPTEDSCNSQLPNLNTQDWYLHSLFQRYWKHYAQAMLWCQNHQIITQKFRQNGCHVYQRHSHPYSKSLLSTTKNKNLKTSKVPMFKIPKSKNQHSGSKKTEQGGVLFAEESITCDDTQISDADSEVYEMEITKEMVDFFAHSEKHRKERDQVKDSTGCKKDSLVDIGQASKKIPTIEAPKERPGLRRTTEMTQIYGKGAAMIHGMETALQMTYDRSKDIKQPPCWPNMPLKIVFK